MRLSVGIPVYNEEQVIPDLLRRLLKVLDSLPGGPHEIVFVDDGSADGSRTLLTEAARRDRRIRVVVLSRNFGHQAALSAALDQVSGDAVVLMDADLQDEPEVIPELMRHHQAGADVVYAHAARQKGGCCGRRIACFTPSLRPFRKSTCPGMLGILRCWAVPWWRPSGRPEQQRYLRGLRAWVGFTQVASMSTASTFRGKAEIHRVETD